MKAKNLVIVRAVTEQGLTPTQAAERFGVSRQWVHTLVRRYQEGGPDAVAPRSKAPHARPQTTPEAVRERIIALRLELTGNGADAGPVTIAWHLEQEGYAAPSTSTIRRVLHMAGLITPEPRKRPRRSYTRFEAALPNECWQADITHWFLSNGTRVEILDFLDDHSRFLLTLRPAAAFNGPMVVATLAELIDTFGPPASTLTDNGLVFTTRLAGRKGAKGGFEKLLIAHGITQKNGRPGHPQTQGKIERFHQTLKRWLKARPYPDTITDLAELLTEFRRWYNTKRPHRSIGRRDSILLPGLGNKPHRTLTKLRRILPRCWHDHHPLGNSDPPRHPGRFTAEWRTRTDIIDTNGTVTLRYAGKLRHLGIGRGHAGTPVLLLIDDRHVSVSSMHTGDIIAEFLIDPAKDYQTKTTPTPRQQ